MPIIDVSILTGRTDEQVRALIGALHEATVSSLAVPPGTVKVLVREVEPHHWGSDGETIAERRAR